MNQAPSRRLRSMPEASVFAKFICCPRQATEIQEATTENDSCGTVASPQDDGAHRNSHSSDERVEEQYLLLVCTEIIGLRKNDDIDDHVDHQNSQRTGRKQALGKAEVLPIKVYASEPGCKSPSNCHDKGLPQGP